MTLKYLLISLLISLYSVCSYSQATPDKLTVGDTTLVVPTEVSNSLDFMLQSWAVRHAAKSNCPTGEIPPLVSDSICKLRLSKLPYLMEMPYNSTVRSYIDLYTLKKRRQMESMLGLSEYYFPVFEQVLGANNLPLELKYLSIIESALNTTIVSRMGAAGLWQLMIATGKMYGLEINSLVDERLSPAKATNAAAHFMKDLHSIYGDWNLVIAAYNCGPGNVNKAIRKAGGKRDYWAIYPYLPRETRGYVPIFIAANYSLHYAREHNLCSANVNMPAITDTIMVRKRLHLSQVASVLRLPLELVRLLNPQYRKDIIPGNTKPYALCLPLKYVTLFMEMQDTIYAYKADSLINNRRGEIEIIENSKHSGQENAGGKVKLHKVLKGQTLKSIAAKYGISVSKLKAWNGIKGDKAKVGTLLQVTKYNAEGAIEPTKEQIKPAVDEKKATLDEPELKPIVSELPKIHTVIAGQSLFSIANFYGVTVENLKQWNGLKDAQVKVGDHLKIRPIETVINKKNIESKKNEELPSKQIINSIIEYHIVTKKQSLLAIAKKYNVSVQEIKDWNDLKNDHIQIGDRLKILKTGEDNAKTSKIEKTINPIVEKTLQAIDDKPSDKEKLTSHTVSQGESLASIATKYNIKVADLKKWNHLKITRLDIGDVLYLNPTGKDNTLHKTTKSTKEEENTPKSKVKKKIKTHTVLRGQNLGSIANRYGVSVDELKKWNKLTDSRLSIGEKIKLGE